MCFISSPLPSRPSKVEVPVMFVMEGFRTGMLDTRCGVVNVEEHVDCQCGCHVTRESCIPNIQHFNNQTCQCVCNNQHLAALCKHEVCHSWKIPKGLGLHKSDITVH